MYIWVVTHKHWPLWYRSNLCQTTPCGISIDPPPLSCPHSYWMSHQVFSKKKIKESNSLDSRIFWPVQRRRKLQRTFHSKRLEMYMFAKKVLTLSSTWILTVSTWMSVSDPFSRVKVVRIYVTQEEAFSNNFLLFANPQKQSMKNTLKLLFASKFQ